MSGEKPRRGDLVAVTGATGFVGQAVLMAAGRHQLDVRALTRRKQRLRGGVEWVDGDLADVPALKRLMDGASAVIHIAGVVNAPDAAGFEEGNVQGTLRVIEAAHEMGVSRLIHVSSLAAREPQLSMYGASKLRGEKLVRASGLDWSVVRPPAVFGPRDTEMLELFRLARRGVIPLPPPGHLSIIHVADLAELLLALLPSGEDVTRKVFEPDDGEPGGWTHVALARAIGAAVREKPVRPLSLSPGIVRLAARADRLLRGKKAKLTPDRARYICHPDWTVSEEARPPASLWRPRIDTREGLQATAAWYREAGWLK
ncbi:epimerase [Novosphingobium fuchskuhlense]|uniref:Epimerase n=1 Tax=Novosphingobium fuchskuhlense TaxID=1117702 RepID=A0A124JTJ1_9SPHN|nr:NAD-dependent epimerase/dehydratase family protein [Novosphingobium fuchskuhlense]KUR70249.1 epimerase [Novosphingobium fuchskuhlense]